MQTSADPGAEYIEILPLVIVTQSFPIRPSALPDIRDFVRRRLTHAPLSDDDVRTLGERVAGVLLDAAGTDGAIQVSLRIFPTYAEVDVVFLQPGEPGTGDDQATLSTGIGAVPPAAGRRAAAGVSVPLQPEGEPPPRPGAIAGNGVLPASGPGPVDAPPVLGNGGAPKPRRDPAGNPLQDPAPATNGLRVPAVSFADWLGAALRREGMTMEAAARQLGVSVKTVSRWAGGTTEPRLRDLSRIREVFGDFPLS